MNDDTTAIKLFLPDENATKSFACSLASILKQGDVVLLQGDLGAGKTSFCRNLIRFCAGNENLDVPSPTFTLVEQYETEKGIIHHYDLYRLEEPEEVFELGFEESLESAITLIEWAERLGDFVPENVFLVAFFFDEDDKGARKAIIQGEKQRITGISWSKNVKIV